MVGYKMILTYVRGFTGISIEKAMNASIHLALCLSPEQFIKQSNYSTRPYTSKYACMKGNFKFGFATLSN